MLLELIGIYAAYKIADRYNDLKEKEIVEKTEFSNLEKQVKILELKKRIKELENIE